MLGTRRRITRRGSRTRRFSIVVIDCKSLAAHVISRVNSAWQSVAYSHILSHYRKGRDRFPFIFFLSFLFIPFPNSTAGSSFLKPSTTRRYRSAESRVWTYPFFFPSNFFFHLSEMTIVSMGACGVARQVASTVAERRRRYTRCISLQAAFVHPNCEVLE